MCIHVLSCVMSECWGRIVSVASTMLPMRISTASKSCKSYCCDTWTPSITRRRVLWNQCLTCCTVISSRTGRDGGSGRQIAGYLFLQFISLASPHSLEFCSRSSHLRTTWTGELKQSAGIVTFRKTRCFQAPFSPTNRGPLWWLVAWLPRSGQSSRHEEYSS